MAEILAPPRSAARQWLPPELPGPDYTTESADGHGADHAGASPDLDLDHGWSAGRGRRPQCYELASWRRSRK